MRGSPPGWRGGCTIQPVIGGKQGRSLSILQLELPRLREGECLEHGLLPPRLCTQAETGGRPDPGLLPPHLSTAPCWRLAAGTTGNHELRPPVSSERASEKTLLSLQTGCGPFRKVQPAVYLSGFPACMARGFLALSLLAAFSRFISHCGLSTLGPRVFQGLSWRMGEGGCALPCFEESQPAPAVLLGICHVQRKLQENLMVAPSVIRHSHGGTEWGDVA